MSQSPVTGIFPDQQSGQRAAVALETAGFDEVVIFTAEQYNSGLVSSNPKENRKAMEKSFVGITVGIVAGAIIGWMFGWPIGRMWAAVSAVALAGVGATIGLLLGDREVDPHQKIMANGGVLLSVRFANPARTTEAVETLRRLGARRVSVNTPGAQMPVEGS